MNAPSPVPLMPPISTDNNPSTTVNIQPSPSKLLIQEFLISNIPWKPKFNPWSSNPRIVNYNGYQELQFIKAPEINWDFDFYKQFYNPYYGQENGNKEWPCIGSYQA